MSEPILRLDHVSRTFRIESKKLFTPPDMLKAVQDISLTVDEGEILGLVGESGCGKSTLGRLMIRLLKPTSGKVYYRGTEISALSEKDIRPFRKQMQFVFQDPYASLNPRMTVEELIMDAMEVQGLYDSVAQRKEKVYELMEECGLDTDYAKRYPHEFSGGQRQRIGIARAMSVDPELMICDEPVSALDVSVQAQIINLLKEMKKQKELTLVFISHDLSVVNHIADRIAVMYLGQIVELAETEELFEHPQHPYTQALFRAIPKVGAGKFDPKKEILEGTIPSPIHLPTGCSFQGRCAYCTEECRKDGAAVLREIAPGHFCSCHLTNTKGAVQ